MDVPLTPICSGHCTKMVSTYIQNYAYSIMDVSSLFSNSLPWKQDIISGLPGQSSKTLFSAAPQIWMIKSGYKIVATNSSLPMKDNHQLPQVEFLYTPGMNGEQWCYSRQELLIG